MSFLVVKAERLVFVIDGQSHWINFAMTGAVSLHLLNQNLLP